MCEMWRSKSANKWLLIKRYLKCNTTIDGKIRQRQSYIKALYNAYMTDRACVLELIRTLLELPGIIESLKMHLVKKERKKKKTQFKKKKTHWDHTYAHATHVSLEVAPLELSRTWVAVLWSVQHLGISVFTESC